MRRKVVEHPPPDEHEAYGFITVLSEGEYKNTDIFVHQSNIITKEPCYRFLVAGENVLFEVKKTEDEKHPTQAVKILGSNNVALKCETPRQPRQYSNSNSNGNNTRYMPRNEFQGGNGNGNGNGNSESSGSGFRGRASMSRGGMGRGGMGRGGMGRDNSSKNGNVTTGSNVNIERS